MEADRIAARWAGGTSPWGLSWQKAMMWLFLVSDALLFAGFLAAYGFIRISAEAWPEPSRVFQLGFITAMTFVLISSSATMASAVAAARLADGRACTRFLGLTVAGGLCFLGMQAWEWTGFIHEGARLAANPWGVPAFSAFFFMITGFHGTHVLIGVLVLAAVALRSRRGMATPEGVELAGLYWHFVDLVWVFIFGLFYLI